MSRAHGDPWDDLTEHAARLARAAAGMAAAGMAAAGHHARHGRGPMPRGGPFPPGFGALGGAFGGPWGGGGRWGRGPRAKRGNVRAAILGLLAEEPRNGYQIIQEINERS